MLVVTHFLNISSALITAAIAALSRIISCVSPNLSITSFASFASSCAASGASISLESIRIASRRGWLDFSLRAGVSIFSASSIPLP